MYSIILFEFCFIISRVEDVLMQISLSELTFDMERLHTVIHRKILDTLDKVGIRTP